MHLLTINDLGKSCLDCEYDKALQALSYKSLFDAKVLKNKQLQLLKSFSTFQTEF